MERLIPLLDEELARNASGDIWPYAATAWRLADDPRSNWLERDGELVRTFDLADALPPLGELADVLRALHVAKGEYLDQSVLGGTQTDGPLLSRIDPTIQALRKVIVGAVEEYVAQLPPIEASHPLLGHRRDRRVRFAGSWSVRLREGGRHANHTHPQGWISSALYISVPPEGTGDAGWLTVGEPDDRLGSSLPPWKKIEPKPGKLVLFPSWMWHGTVPFQAGERLSVAFDVAVPR
nr:putative 2OG-Fe(II) oxygenase [Sphingomonas hankyongi]